MSCHDGGHAHVVAGGSCTDCGLPVIASGPMPAVGDGPLWSAPPFAMDGSGTCRVTGGPHRVSEGARATCTACSAVLFGAGDGRGATWWAEGALLAVVA